ncbi:peptidylprolyl isomerase [Pelagibacteraceae bacterium]|jgi:peptidyl-prolyl cis-trans isomerase SurA|nr:peptidylprolyl isomerase [Pelagibacteraceae bacterium]
MKKKKYLLLILLIFFFKISYTNASIQNKIIATVNNEIVTSYELKNKIMTFLILNKVEVNQENINNYKNQSLKTLINMKIRKNELVKYNLLNSKIDTSRFIEQQSKKYNFTIEEFKKEFLNNNLSYDLYLQEIQLELGWQQLILQLYGNKIIVDEYEIDEELKKIIDTQKEMIEYRLSEIEVQVNDNEKITDLVEEIQNQIIKDGFKNTAIKYSTSSTALEGGEIGWVNSESLSNKMLNAISNMKLKEVSKPMMHNNSILFVKLEEIKKVDALKINSIETKKKIIDQKKNELLNLFSNSHLSKIRNNASIELIK